MGDLSSTYSVGNWSVFYGVSLIGKTSDEADLRFSRGGDICLASALRGGDICPVFKFKAQTYHNASITNNFQKKFSVTLGVSNIFNNKPPRVGAFAPFGGFGQTAISGTQYDLVGRRGFVSIRTKL